MNIEDFLNYCIYCPLCKTKLNTQFHSDRRQQISYFNDKLMPVFDLVPIKRNQRYYKVGYCFDIVDNSFEIEFFDKANWHYFNECPLFLINRFKELNKNLKQYKFSKTCLRSGCQGYVYNSNFFSLDLEKSNICDLNVENEGITIEKCELDKYIFINLINNYSKSNASLSFSTHRSHYDLKEITCPIIPITNKEQLLNKIETYLTFI